MKIYPLTLAGRRCMPLLYLQKELIEKRCPKLEKHIVAVRMGHELKTDSGIHFTEGQTKELERSGFEVIDRPPGYWPWPTVEHCMVKFSVYKKISERMGDGDYLLDMDSDAFITDGSFISGLGEYEVAGALAPWPDAEARFGKGIPWSWTKPEGCVSINGSFIILSGKAIRKMISRLEETKKELTDWIGRVPGLVHDRYTSVLSYISGCSIGWPCKDWRYAEGKSAENVFTGKEPLAHVVHLYGYGIDVHEVAHWPSFAGQPISSKYEIPSVIKKLGLL